jgi:hypothetical protein
MTEALIPSPKRTYSEILYCSYAPLATMRRPGVPLHDLLERVRANDPTLFFSFIGGNGAEASWNVCSWITQAWIDQQRRIFAASPSRFRRVVLNEQIIGGDGDTLLTIAEIQAAIDPAVPAEPERASGQRYIGGLDLAVSNDHACLLIGHLDRRGAFVVDVCQVWKPSERAIEFTDIKDAVLRWHRVLPMKALNVDQWNAKLLVEVLQRAGVPARLIGVEQTRLNEVITVLKTTFSRRAIRISPSQTYLLEQLEALRVLETRTPRRDLLKFAPSGTGLDASQHDDAAVALGLALTDRSLLNRLGHEQMPAIWGCHAADVLGRLYIELSCPLIDDRSANPGCKSCAPFAAARAQQADELQRTGVYRSVRAIASDWQPCRFITQWKFERACQLL